VRSYETYKTCNRARRFFNSFVFLPV